MQQNLGQILSFFVPSLSNIFSFIMGFVTSLLASYMYAYLQRRTGSRYLRAFRRRTPLDRELVSQGIGNTLCGLLGGLPITAVIVRSSANINAGGRTKVAAVFHGLLLLLATLFLAEVLNLIPLAALASVLLVVGYKLAKPALFHSMLRLTADQSIPFLVTVAAVLLTNLLEGV